MANVKSTFERGPHCFWSDEMEAQIREDLGAFYDEEGVEAWLNRFGTNRGWDAVGAYCTIERARKFFGHPDA